MVVQNFKSKNALESALVNLTTDMSCDRDSGDNNVSLITNRNRILCGNIMYVAFTGILILFNITVLCITINKDTTVKLLQAQVENLQRDVDKFKHRFFDDDLLKELGQFQLQSYTDEEDSKDFVYDMETNENDDYTDTDTEDKDRKKREVMAATLDGVPIITESYAAQKRRNGSAAVSQARSEGLRLYESLSTPITHKHQSTGWTPRTYVNNGNENNQDSLVTRPSRFMQTETKPVRSKIVKKSLLKSSKSKLQEHVESIHVTVTPPPSSPGGKRSHRHGHDRDRHGRRRELVEATEAAAVAAHYHGNTSHLSSHHHMYRGNGQLAHPQGQYVHWHPSWWMSRSGSERHFQLRDGEVTVAEAGLYWVYAQIYYVDEHDLNGYEILVNGTAVARCVTMTQTHSKLQKTNSCWTAALVYLMDGDRLSIKDMETHRYAFMAHANSFFGLVKLADLNIKHNSSIK